MTPNSSDFEKLGVFYLGRSRSTDGDPAELLLYDSKDLTTHAVVIGMTGSGKTGLCINLLEEAALDHIPAIVIDPKGDIANLLLTFPELSTEAFLPWVDPGQAARAGLDLKEFAAAEASKWREGLSQWGQDEKRIQTLRQAVEMRVYTPGSSAGRPLTILKSFEHPPNDVRDDSDLFRERISSTVSGLLGLLGLNVDPIRSREHILVSKLLEHHWRAGEGLDLGQLITRIKSPPFRQVGVLDVDEFYPPRDRSELAMTLNNLLASPSFSSWLSGESLDIKNMLHTAAGKPCVSILSISHLSDAERMFFVTILLNEVLAWMRTQAGTSSLRAILYMDEVFGYFPPVQNPPSKLPMLTLLKQARAFGLGVVLATQNPVDLDYKGLANTGTWFLGRLQTERDKARVIEGLEGAAAQNGTVFNRSQMEQTLAGLSSRVFLMNNVHDDRPVVFETRWAMSYLRGPLTRQQIQKLVPAKTLTGPAATSLPDTAKEKTDTSEETDTGGEAVTNKPPPRGGRAAELPTRPPTAPAIGRDALPVEIPQKFIYPVRRPSGDSKLCFRPVILAHARLHFVKAGLGVDSWLERQIVQTADEAGERPEFWAAGQIFEEPLDFIDPLPESSEFESVPAEFQSLKFFKSCEKSARDYLYRHVPLTLQRCVELDVYCQPGESLGEFKARLETQVNERRDLEKEKLRQKYASRYQTTRDGLERAQQRAEREKSQFKARRMDSILDLSTSIMGAIFGRKTTRASSSVRSINKASAEKAEMRQAEANLETWQNKYRDLDAEFNQAYHELGAKLQVDRLTFEEISIPPRKADLAILGVYLAWLPFIVSANGVEERAY